MREDRIIALAGLMQALSLVRSIALRGSCDAQAMRDCLNSVLRVDADTAAEIYGGIGHLSLGLRTLIEQLDKPSDVTLMRMGSTVLRLERALARRPEMLAQLREQIDVVARF